MRIETVKGRYDLIAPLYDLDAAALRAQDEQDSLRLVALENGEAVGAVRGIARPDRRVAASFRGRGRAALARALIEAAARPVVASVAADDPRALEELHTAGFEVDFVEATYDVRFDRALAALRRAWVPRGFTIVSARDVDPDLLFELDIALRRDVRGTEGWQGNRDWFNEELNDDPAFDPDAYLVGVHSTGGYGGLVRMWRNEHGPRLGLIGVLPVFRSTVLAAALLARSVAAAATWGFETFEASSANPIVLRRLERLGATVRGRRAHLLASRVNPAASSWQG